MSLHPNGGQPAGADRHPHDFSKSRRIALGPADLPNEHGHAASVPEVEAGGAWLPLADSGKAQPSRNPLQHVRPGRSWLTRLSFAGIFLGLGAIGGAYLLPLVTGPAGDGLATEGAPSAEVGGRQSGAVGGTDLLEPEVVALGRLRPDGGALALALPSGAGDARIARLLVSEGDAVAAGETIAELDNMPILIAARAAAQAGLDAQQAALEQVRVAMLSNLAEARANHLAADATLKLANEALDRQKRLAASNSTTQVLVDQAQGNVVRARAEFDRTAALTDRFAGAASGELADIVEAKRNLELANANLARAESDIASAKVVAPRAGTVLEIHTHEGEKPSDEGVMTIGDVSRMTAMLEVYQTDIKDAALGQSVTMTAPALPGPLQGQVTLIGQIVGRQSVMSSEPGANADARVVQLTVTLDARSSAIARSYTNLEIIGRIRRTGR